MASIPSNGRSWVRRTGIAAVVVATPVALAYRFAVVYRRRAGFPARRAPVLVPADLGLPSEEVSVPSSAGPLAGWFVPARGGLPGPGVVVVHGWESGRDRALPHAQFLHAAGFHCLLIDVRGHGANPPEKLPISAGEFAADAGAGLDVLLARPEVTCGAILGHSMGAVGALVAAAAARERCGAVVSVSGPADPHLLTRETFRLAHLHFPPPLSHPLSWVTARVYVRPRGHAIREISARHAARSYAGPILIVHGERDEVIPVSHSARLERAAVRSRDARITAGRDRPRGPCTRGPTGRGAGARHPPRRRRRRTQLALRGRGLSPGRGGLPGSGSRRSLCAGGGRRASRRRAGRSAARARHPLLRSRLRRPTTMDVWTAIRAKRAVRAFDARPIEPADLERILDAGRRAGSAKNGQRWDFVVCRDREHLGRLADLGPWAGHLAGASVAVALVTPDPRTHDAPLSILFDLGQAAENMMLAAWELGIGSVPATVYEHDLARELLGYPADRHCEFLISFGHPADPDDLVRPPRAGKRRPLADVVHEERW